MLRPTVRIRAADPLATAQLAARFERIRSELGVATGFPPEVLQAAAAAAANPDPPDGDLRDVAFITVDPQGSTDLDQAMSLSRRGDGFTVDYAIADVPGFVRPNGPVDREAMRRGQTLYAPDARTPLHPPVLSEDAASLLPGVDRPAFVWRFELDGAGEVRSVEVVRALVRSRRRLDYAAVQAAADGAPADDLLAGQAALLREIGRLRRDLECARGGASLPRPDQEVSATAAGYRLRFSPALPAHDWNAQLSLMTGMAAARLMLDAGVGILRTLPRPDPKVLGRFRARAGELGIDWAPEQTYGEFVRTLDPAVPAHLALLHAASSLFRGAGYTPFDGAVPDDTGHAAVAAPYAHATAPLRRLVDRFVLVASHAASQGRPVPDWVRAALPALPPAMAASDRLAGRLERRCLDTAEAVALADRVGESFDAVAVDADRDGDGGRVQIAEPAVLARCAGLLAPGTRLRVRLVAADPDEAVVRFATLEGADEPDGRPRRAG